MLLINCIVKLNLRWKNHSVLSGLGIDNDNANSNDIIFAIKNFHLTLYRQFIATNEYKYFIESSFVEVN